MKVHTDREQASSKFQILDLANIDNVSPVSAFIHVSIQSIHGLILRMWSRGS